MHSLADVAANNLPPDWKDGARWLRTRLNRGEIYGTRYGRTWMMSDADIEYMVSKYRNTVQPHPIPADVVADNTPEVEPVTEPVYLHVLSARSARRIKQASA